MPMLTTVCDPFAGVASPRAVADFARERLHASQDPVHLGHHVDAVDDQRRTGGHPQRDVQRGSILGRR